MTEERKRRIVVSSGEPAATAAEAVDEHISSPDLEEEAESRVKETLAASLYIPVPAIIIGFAALIIFTFSLTVVITYWPESTPEIGENPRIRQIEAALEPGYAIERPEGLISARGVEEPVAEVEISGRRAAARPALSGAETSPGIARARGATAPIADISPEPRSAEATPGTSARVRTAALGKAASAPSPITVLDPESRLPAFARNDKLAKARSAGGESGQGQLTDALGLSAPVTMLDLPEREEPATAAAAAGRQKLMFRRYAKAASDPVLREEPESSIVVVAPENRPAAPSAFEPAPDTLFGEEVDKPWQRYAAAIPDGAAGKPKVVIIIDDMGNSPGITEALSNLKAPLGFAFLPYAPSLGAQTGLVRARGHELLVHLPMEPEGGETPGPHALYSGLADDEIRRALDWNLSRFPAYVGVNNHMGSHLTADSRVMEIVLGELKARGLLFLDSLTTPETVGPRLARTKGLPWAGRDVFLDNVPEDAAIHAQLMQVERIAKERGLAIAIGHPHRATLQALEDWLPTLEGKGLALVPLSAVVNFEGKTRLAIRTPVAGGQ